MFKSDEYDFDSDDQINDQGGDDEIQEIVSEYQLQDQPYNYVGQIQSTNLKGGRSPIYGTGILIGQDVVLTAAHNIFNKQKSQICSPIKFYYKFHGVSKIEYEVIDCRLSDQYTKLTYSEFKKPQSVKYDYAVLKLNKKIIIPFCISLMYNFYNINQEISLCGYPLPSKQKNFLYNQLSKSEGDINSTFKIRIDDHNIKYTLSSKPGQSGGPVYYDKSNIIAIHKAAVNQKKSQTFKYNIGRLFTKEMIKMIEIWGQQMKCSIKCQFKDYMKESSHSIMRTAPFMEKKQSISLFQIEQNKYKEFPYNCVGVIKTKFDQLQDYLYGTGMLISQNLVLTSSSCIYHAYFSKQRQLSYQQFKLKTKINFYLSPKGPLKKQCEYQVQNFQMSPQFLSVNLKSIDNLMFSNFHDFCLLKLKTPIKQSDYLSLTISKIPSLKYMILGYPNDDVQNYKQYSTDIKQVQTTKQHQLLIYRIQTRHGMAGSPILNKNNDVIGFHKCKIKRNNIRNGRMITTQMAEKLLKWRCELNGVAFILKFLSQNINEIVKTKEQLQIFEIKSIESNS